MKLHKLAKLFPEIVGADFKALTLDIKSNGLRQPITTRDGKILDGVNRYRACISADIEPKFVEYDGDDPLGFVISQNLSRRHLTDDQRAAIAAEIATAKPGGDREHVAESATSKTELTTAQAAEEMQVSKRLVQRAKQVQNESPREFSKVKKGKQSLNSAHEKKHPRKPRTPKPTNHRVHPDPVLPPEPSPVRILQTTDDPTTTPLLLAQFAKAVHALEARIPNGDKKHHYKYGEVLSAAAERQINWGTAKIAKGAYGF